MSNAQPTTECLLKSFHGNSIDEEFFFPIYENIRIFSFFSYCVTIERIQSVNLEMRVQTPGKLGSAQPMPQLMIPPRNHRPSLPLTTRGPPESPWNKIQYLKKNFIFNLKIWAQNLKGRISKKRSQFIMYVIKCG